MKINIISSLLFSMVCLSCSDNIPESLVPSNSNSKVPDYFCTWNLQAYVCNSSSNDSMRYAMNEKNIFGKEKYENWINAYPEIREDLLFVLDDSWDIPSDANNVQDNPYLGLSTLDTTRFPSFTGTPAERLQKLVNAVESKGWKGIGGWICAQEAPVLSLDKPEDIESYWIERLKEANFSGFDYWKVDWGKEASNGEWRKRLTELGRKYAPNMYLEHALDENFITFSDVYRTYDVENVISQPVTIERIVGVLDKKVDKGARGLINCEDEPYIAAGLGCLIGVMRHQFKGSFPNGEQDFAFPPSGRDVKNRRDEVIRGVRWHRIAEPFGVGSSSFEVDSKSYEDYWIFKPRETWYYWGECRQEGDTIRASAPARISRGLQLADVINKSDKPTPYILSSLYPNGAIAIAAIGRTTGRQYECNPVTVVQKVPSLSYPIGIFGRFESLDLELPNSIGRKSLVLAQDLASNKAEDVTSEIIFKENKVIIPGKVINRIGLQYSSSGDKSDPGLVLQFFD